MSYVTREQAVCALFSALQGSASYVTSSRRLKLWTDVPVTDRPALFLTVHGEEVRRGTDIAPAMRTLSGDIYIYTNAKDPNTIGDTLLNNLIDAIDPLAGGVLAPNPLTNLTTLGGVVYDCYIDGKILREPGDMDGDGIALIPIKIILP
jgi:hypothetical protein